MLIVGEAINTSRKIKGQRIVEEAVVSRNAEYIGELAKKQAAAGATYIDVNAGTLTEGEPEALEWITQVVNAAVDKPVCFDSPNPEALVKALQAYDKSKGQPMINSITAEKARYERILPIVLEYGAKVIALAMDDSGIQSDPGKRLTVARTLVTDLTAAGVPVTDIYVDPLTFPIGTGSDVGVSMLEIISSIMTEFPGVHTIAGLSNISHGMPTRKLLNQAMTILSMGKGLDAGIVDPNDKYLMGLIAASEALLGCDEFCMNYIGLSRAGAFEEL